MKELVRSYIVIPEEGRNAKVRVFKESGDIAEGIQRLVRSRLVLNTDVNWRFSVEQRNFDFENDEMLIFRAKAIGDNNEVFFYDFAVTPENEDLKERFVEAVEAITGQYVKED